MEAGHNNEIGPINKSATSFLYDLGWRISLVSGKDRDPRLLFQRISVAVQRFNAFLLHDRSHKMRMLSTMMSLLICVCSATAKADSPTSDGNDAECLCGTTRYDVFIRKSIERTCSDTGAADAGETERRRYLFSSYDKQQKNLGNQLRRAEMWTRNSNLWRRLPVHLTSHVSQYAEIHIQARTSLIRSTSIHYLQTESWENLLALTTALAKWF